MPFFSHATFATMSNYTRMLQLAEEVFAVHDDPTQLQVDAEVLAQLRRLHPASVSEEADADGPVAWILLIPTTVALMDAFLVGTITEQELYERTPLATARCNGSADVLQRANASPRNPATAPVIGIAMIPIPAVDALD